MHGTFPELSCGAVAKKAIACASNRFGMPFFSLKKAELTHRGFSVCRYLISYKSGPHATQRSAYFPYRVFFELFRFIQSSFPYWEDLRADEKQTFQNPIEFSSDVTVDKHCTDDGIAGIKSTALLHQDYMNEDDVWAWIINRRALLAVCLRRIAAPLNLDGAYDDDLWKRLFRGWVLLTKRHCEP